MAENWEAQGKLIVLEGLDGSGKATQTALLCSALASGGRAVRQVSFPDYESDSSALVRMYLRGEFGSSPNAVNAYAASSFYAVDRCASFLRDWGAFYRRGGLILADRYTTSNAVHQCCKLPESQWDAYLDWLFDYEYRLLGIPVPDLVVYLRVGTEDSSRLLDRRYHGNADRRDIHERDLAYQRRAALAADYCAGKLGWKVVQCEEPVPDGGSLDGVLSGQPLDGGPSSGSLDGVLSCQPLDGGPSSGSHDGVMRSKTDIHREVLSLVRTALNL